MKRIIDKIDKIDIKDSEIIQDIERAKKIPGFDINVMWWGNNNWSLLMYAVWKNRRELIEYLLLDPRINVNHRNYYDSTALHLCERVSILKLLLNRKDIDVNIQSTWGWTVLHWACRWGRKAWVKELLLDARMNTYIRDRWKKTAWDIALERGYPGIAKIVGNSEYTTLLRIPNSALLHDIVRMIIEEYA